jgi:hypothetical protein
MAWLVTLVADLLVWMVGYGAHIPRVSLYISFEH